MVEYPPIFQQKKLFILVVRRVGRMLTVVSGTGVVKDLVKGSWDSQSLEKNSLLSLESDVLWPSDESGQISDWLDGSTQREVSWGSFEQSLVGTALGGLSALLGTFLLAHFFLSNTYL